MKDIALHRILTVLIAAVWLVNGLVCKVLDYVPRHQDIVQKITNVDRPSAAYLTFLIGIAEVFMALWILSRFKSKINAVTQIAVVATMNILEFVMAPELLLWGRLNILFALLFIGLVYYNEFRLNRKSNLKAI